jgi:ribosome biogenesis GTPase
VGSVTGRAGGRSPQDWDEDDIRVRPGKSSRPRTRIRPGHDDAEPGFIIAVDRGRYTCRLETDGQARAVTAMRARELGRKSVVVGDRVELVGDTSGHVDTLARIVRITARSSVLRRTADDDDGYERVVVANAEQLVVVTALADPPPRTGLIDRCLVAAYDAGLEALLCLTKSDLATPDTLLDHYADLELRALSWHRGQPLEELRAVLSNRISVLVGHSGVGKSTLVNALVPGTDRTTGVVSAIGKGRHTSTSAIALALPGGGWVIDTPGIRSFGLAHVSPERLLDTFTDLAEGAADCPRGCGHSAAEPECGLDAWVASGHAASRRLAAYRRLLDSRAGISTD